MGTYDGGLLKGTTNTPHLVFFLELLQWHKVCEIGGDKLHRPLVVALTPSCAKVKTDTHTTHFPHFRAVHHGNDKRLTSCKTGCSAQIRNLSFTIRIWKMRVCMLL